MARVKTQWMALTLATAISLSTAAPAKAYAQPPIQPAAEENLNEGNALTGGGPIGIILALIIGAAILYGIYDVLIQSDNADVPASP
jgi:hypothetical protein